MHCEAKSVIIPLLTEGYRSGHNGAVLKTVRAKVHRGSNPLPSAIICKNLTNSGGVFIYRVSHEILIICDASTFASDTMFRDDRNGREKA